MEHPLVFLAHGPKRNRVCPCASRSFRGPSTITTDTMYVSYVLRTAGALVVLRRVTAFRQRRRSRATCPGCLQRPGPSDDTLQPAGQWRPAETALLVQLCSNRGALPLISWSTRLQPHSTNRDTTIRFRFSFFFFFFFFLFSLPTCSALPPRLFLGCLYHYFSSRALSVLPFVMFLNVIHPSFQPVFIYSFPHYFVGMRFSD